jgi:alcohol dehydrogenase
MTTARLMAFEGTGLPFAAQDHLIPVPGPDEILVRNHYTTICGSDLHTFSGLRKEACPTVLGHEIVGEIVALGDAHAKLDQAGMPLAPGDMVTWSVFSSDAHSDCALRGMPQKGTSLFKYGHARIETGDAFHGGLAAYCLLKKGTAVLKLPEDMPLDVAAPINCAIATAAGALRLAGAIRGKSVLITGMGLLGLSCAAMCREAGASNIIAADQDEKRLDTALQFGAHHIMDMRNIQNLETPVIDIAFDMSGAPDAMEYGLNALTIGGIAVWVGAVFQTRKIQVDAERMIRRILSIKGLHNYNFEDFGNALSFMSAHWQDYPFASVVEKEFPLEQTQEAFEFALAHKPLRAGIRI